MLKYFVKSTGKHLRPSHFLIKLQRRSVTSLKKETLAMVFSCEFGEIFKNTFFYRRGLVAASIVLN